jgi:hypothetical protein
MRFKCAYFQENPTKTQPMAAVLDCTVIEPFPSETEALIVAVRVDFHWVGRAASRIWAVGIDTTKAVGVMDIP